MAPKLLNATSFNDLQGHELFNAK